ncbi:MAG: hypothetical protein LBT19_00930 [Candidatus Nomurabacteria bacterium]|jgi:membrane protein implicated in regulation of membrane protease activity|nr:hypothetical protein [Candidatus Nomurabacteria bacterium]
MKKFRLIIRAATFLLAVVVIVGAIVLVMSQSSALDTAFDIIAFAISAASVAVAIISQVSAYNVRKKLTKMVRELSAMDAEIIEDERLGESIKRKLNEIAAIDKEIYRKLDQIELGEDKERKKKKK